MLVLVEDLAGMRWVSHGRRRLRVDFSFVVPVKTYISSYACYLRCHLQCHINEDGRMI